MNKRVKVLVSILTATLISTALFGCGKKDNGADKGKTGGKEIVVWSHLNEGEVAGITKIAEEWAKKTGNTVKVKLDKSEFQEILTAANSSKGPDVLYGFPHDNLGTYKKANLLSEVPAGMLDKSKYVNDNVINAVSYDNKQYAIPLALETTALFYNTDKIKEAPKTVEDLVKLGKEYGFQYDINNFYFSYAFLSGNGAYVFKNNNGTLDPNDIGLGNDGAKKGYELIQKFVTENKFMTPDIKGDIAKGNFQAGKSALYISGPWDVAALKDAGVKFAVAPLPQLDGKPMKPFMGVQTAFANAKSKNVTEAWDLIKYINENSQKVLLEKGNRIPGLKSAYDDKDVKENKFVQAFLDQSKNAELMPNITEVQAMWTPAGNNLILLTSGKTTPEDAAKKIVEQMKQGIAQQGK